MARFLKWIVNIILLLSIVVAGALLIPPLAGVTTVIIDEVDMDTNLGKGSVTYAIDDKVTELEIGDDVLVSESDSNYVYRVKSIDTSDGACVLEDTKNPNSEPVTKTFRSNVPKVVLSVPFIGYISMAMKSTEGLIIIGLAVVFVVILFVLAELWRPDDDEEDEDDEDAEEEYETERPVRRPVHVDMSSQIMEEASNAIASAVSSVVEQERLQGGRSETPYAEENILADAFETEELEIIPEEPEFKPEAEPVEEAEDVLEIEQLLRQEEALVSGGHGGDVQESGTEPEADDDLRVLLQEFETTDEGDLWEEPEEEESAETAESAEEEAEETEEPETEEEQMEEKTLAMPVCTAEELLRRAKEEGEEPGVVKDEDSGVTILDYSDLL
ncbi:hypothetical protein MCG98_16995 [Ruminococcus sp. OA3]|uniref:hypothetical protein n=1 Tax=Ruminococcus sp. OA3 TaxID=2914164 RepID=UPI001F05F6F4|nr:hypothetical protein [Ruminococcus sp. OA3]MCH1984266.1 hypothetical protein [Ruminococcus sp. OA3]